MIEQKDFLESVKNHHLHVSVDNGVYRHLAVKQKDNSDKWYEIITWPNSLTINGDMGTYTFTRQHDMFEFFGGNIDNINPGYWGEKLVSNSLYGETKDHWDTDHAKEIFYECLHDYLWNELMGYSAENPEFKMLDDDKFDKRFERFIFEEDDGCYFGMSFGSEFSFFESLYTLYTNFDVKISKDKTESFEVNGSDDFGDMVRERHREFYRYGHHYIWCLYAICHAINLYKGI